jgi:hypothetical protein
MSYNFCRDVAVALFLSCFGQRIPNLPSGLRPRAKVTTPERAVRNSLLIRGVNERINGLSDSWPDDSPRELLCECGDESCIEAILVLRADYEAAAWKPGRYLVDSKHGDERGVNVLMTRDGYSIVEYQ